MDPDKAKTYLFGVWSPFKLDLGKKVVDSNQGCGKAPKCPCSFLLLRNVVRVKFHNLAAGIGKLTLASQKLTFEAFWRASASKFINCCSLSQQVSCLARTPSSRFVNFVCQLTQCLLLGNCVTNLFPTFFHAPFSAPVELIQLT